MDAIFKHISKIRMPSDHDDIYKDECVYSYDNPESPAGLYISLSSFLGFGEDYVQYYAVQSGNYVFLHIDREKHLKDEAAKKDECGPERKITRLAIGLEGGYKENDTDKYEYKNNYSIVIMPEINNKIPYPNSDFPLIITQSVEAIVRQNSAISKLERDMISGSWDGEIRMTSEFSEKLQQINNGKKIPPSGWKCEKCDITNNLWLNLTDGSILCGRKFFDGSGGNDHAVEHYRKTKYPLAVKLGTITPDGNSDVFSYPEDEMVVDSKLEQHLAHFGINMAAMKKSEKSIVELELEVNQRIGEWSLLTESESELQPLSGPGYTGMRNLGNSCYMNSVMQVLFTIPDFIKRFAGSGAETYFNQFPRYPASDFNIQMAKLGNGLWSGKYSRITENSLDSTGISPTMFKNVIGKNHPDFGTKQQQDAYDFYLHLINMINRNSRRQLCNPTNSLKFSIEDRVECMSSKKVKYTRREEYCLQLTIPLEKATNLDEVKEYLEKKAKKTDTAKNDKDVVRHKIPLHACLETFFAPEIIEKFYSSAINGITTAKNTARLVNMPEYLMMHLRKFTLGEDWVPKKLDVEIEMPDELDLSGWKATGIQAGEEELLATRNTTIAYDPSIVSSLLELGFPQEACRKAAYHTNNKSVDVALAWLVEHINDDDFAAPFVIPNVAADDTALFAPDPESLNVLMNMGFDERQATRALKATEGDIGRATDWIFSHVGDVGSVEDSFEEQQSTVDSRAGSGKYKLVAFISHMGTSAQVGHYVCHIKKDGKWVIFNDSKVALSQNPPKNFGYLYLYKSE